MEGETKANFNLINFARTILIVVRSRTLIIHVDLILETTTGINSLEQSVHPCCDKIQRGLVTGITAIFISPSLKGRDPIAKHELLTCRDREGARRRIHCFARLTSSMNKFK